MDQYASWVWLLLLFFLNSLASWIIGWLAGYEARRQFDIEMSQGSSDSGARDS